MSPPPPHLIEGKARRPRAGELGAGEPHDGLGLLVPDHAVARREEGPADVGHLKNGMWVSQLNQSHPIHRPVLLHTTGISLPSPALSLPPSARSR